MEGKDSRTAALVGSAGVVRLRSSHVIVFGLGGVGGYALEALARAGVGTLTIVDHDTLKPSNLNRQLLALHSNIGRSKAEVARERIADIDPSIKVNLERVYLDRDTRPAILSTSPDHIVDAIDSLGPKVHLIYNAHLNSIPIISSMGAGSRLDATAVRVGDLSDTRHTRDGLAAKVRKKLASKGIREGHRVVYSIEAPRSSPMLKVERSGEGTGVIRGPVTRQGTISYVPAVFGLFLAGEVLRDLLGDR